MITVTSKAIAEVKKLMTQESDDKSGLRVGVKGGGCSGLTYVLDFIKEPRTDDRVFEFDGIKIFMDPKSAI